MKKVFALILIMIITATAMVACSSKPAEVTPTAIPATDAPTQAPTQVPTETPTEVPAAEPTVEATDMPLQSDAGVDIDGAQ